MKKTVSENKSIVKPDPPHSEEAEQRLLGAMLIDNKIVHEIQLKPSDFYNESHKLIYEEIIKAAKTGLPFDPVSICNGIDPDKLKMMGGLPYIGGMANNVGTSFNAASYANVIKEYSNKRHIMQIADDIAELTQANVDPEKIKDITLASLAQIQTLKNQEYVIVNASLELPIKISWTIKNYIENRTFTLLVGPTATGKSALAIDMSLCIASGIDWFGNPVEPGAVVYICGEGYTGITRRIKAWFNYHCIDEENNKNFFISKRSAGFLDQKTTQNVIRTIDDIAKTKKIALIVIDTLSRNYGPGEENSNDDMAKFVEVLDGIKDKYQCAMLVLHHTGHADKTRGRGASALKAAADHEYVIEPIDDDDRIFRLYNTKMKESDRPKELIIKLQLHDLPWCNEDGSPIRSIVPVETDLDSVDISGPDTAKLGKTQKIILDTVAELKAKFAENIGDDSRKPMVSVDDLRDALDSKGLFLGKHGKTDRYRAVQKLIKRGLLSKKGVWLK